MHRAFTLCFLLLTLFPPCVLSQDEIPAVGLALGAGNAFGGIGLRGEVFLFRGRLSVLGGAGVFPDIPRTITGAASVRYYVGGRQHRLYADLSWSWLQVSIPVGRGSAARFDYGPGLSLGYSFVSQIGVTFTAGGGLGFADYGEHIPIAQLGVGWTWRRRLRK